MAKELMEIGGFITSGAEIVNHDASLSGNGTVDSPLGLNNETVLWENSAGATAASLSESYKNFDRIGLTLQYWPGLSLYQEWPSTAAKVFYVGGWNDNNSYAVFVGEYSGASDTNIQLMKNAYHNITGATSWTNAIGNAKLFKVIGINRLNANN